MANIIDKSINDVKFRIPKEILKLAFLSESNFKVKSLDEQIRHLVVIPRVLTDINMISCNTMYVPLLSSNVTHSDDFGFVVHVPKKQMNNKSIVEPEAITQLDAVVENRGYQTDGNTSYVEVNTNLQLIGENTFQVVGDDTTILNNSFLRCSVNYSNTLRELQPGSYRNISKLVTLAVKAYIHNSLVVKLDMGYVYQGAELGVIKDLVSNLEGAEEEYDDHLNLVVGKSLFMADKPNHNAFVQRLFQPTY